MSLTISYGGYMGSTKPKPDKWDIIVPVIIVGLLILTLFL